MNKMLGLAIFVFAFSITPLHAQTPREQLRQMVEQLQASPTDSALRVRIINVVRALKPKAAVPEEAERHMAYGMAAFKGAKSLADYKDATKEFEQATLAAPWWGDAYYNLGVAQDKAELYDAAIGSLKLAQLALPGSKDVKDLTYQVEYRSKKVNSQVAEAARQRDEQAREEARQRNEQEAFVKSLDGADFYCAPHEIPFSNAIVQEVVRIKGNTVSYWRYVVSGVLANSDGSDPSYAGEFFDAFGHPFPLKLTGGHLSSIDEYDIAQDGKSITEKNGPVCTRH